MATKKMILDLDTGVDDALALAYAIADPNIDLIGVVASYGNNLLEQTAKNSLQLLELLGQDVPVFKGLSHSSTTDHFTVMQVSKEIHGNNGMVIFHFLNRVTKFKLKTVLILSLKRLISTVKTSLSFRLVH